MQIITLYIKVQQENSQAVKRLQCPARQAGRMHIRACRPPAGIADQKK
ncbi:hypothetical protein B0I18_10612 [Taibaiella chishuiensis]|uniref:Uncharacterized protein n=1 Tax=Taibaiella chishuiensis TaxID=1434707 RepID=A0A2P8D1B0_9BACT|nr:hypothetical protein B0I18_10612 [Taibaiella chishuiensis]